MLVLFFPQAGDMQVWRRPILPAGSFALVFLNLHTGGGPQMFARTLTQLGLTNNRGYGLTDTFTGDNIGSFKPSDTFKTFVNPNGVTMVTALPMK